MVQYPPQGGTSVLGDSIGTSELEDNAVTDDKIATHVSTKITGLPAQTQTLDMNANAVDNFLTLTSNEANPAAGGRIRLGQNAEINWRNIANDGDFGIELNGNDDLEIGTDVDLLGDLELAGGANLGQIRKIYEDFFDEQSVTTNVPTGSGWLFTDVAGTGSGSVIDGIDEGYRITTGTVSADRSYITKNDIRHFDAALCTVYGILKHENVTEISRMGISAGADLGAASVNTIVCIMDTNLTNVGLYSSDGTSTTTETNVVNSANAVTFKIINDATNMRLFILESGAWVLKVTKTTNKPTGAMQPAFGCRTRAGSAHFANAIYLKVQND